jgi:hypothetical protein
MGEAASCTRRSDSAGTLAASFFVPKRNRTDAAASCPARPPRTVQAAARDPVATSAGIGGELPPGAESVLATRLTHTRALYATLRDARLQPFKLAFMPRRACLTESFASVLAAFGLVLALILGLHKSTSPACRMLNNTAAQAAQCRSAKGCTETPDFCVDSAVERRQASPLN